MRTTLPAVCLALFVTTLATAAAPPSRDEGSAQSRVAPPPRETVLFPFDDYALPFNKGLVLTLLPGRKSSVNPGLGIDPKHPSRPVLAVGKPGDPDHPRAYFCGTVLHIDGQYRMWYSGFDGQKRRVCYATSKDGVKWAKPKLGLANYNDSTANNLPSIDGNEPIPGMIILVIHDADDPNPDRRFKMIREVNAGLLLAAVSPDGLRWKSAAGNADILKHTNMEPSGFIRHNGVYYLNGHGGPVPHPVRSQSYMRPQKRTMVTLVSYDFENWSDAGHVSFRRDNVPPRPVLDWEFHVGEQVHLGASLWDRGNVLLGFYGMYHNPTNDRRTSSCDIGLIVSHDAIHFREPIPDFKIIPSFEEEDRAEPRLTQGQAFHNVGDRTFVYYGIWTEVNRNSPTGVRIATWPRDRLGFFSPAPGLTPPPPPPSRDEGSAQSRVSPLPPAPGSTPHCISSPLTPRNGARVYLNATHLSDQATLTVELLDEQLRPVPGYTAADFIPIEATSGLRIPVAWRNKPTIDNLPHPLRVRINWAGPQLDNTKLYAVYIE